MDALVAALDTVTPTLHNDATQLFDEAGVKDGEVPIDSEEVGVDDKVIDFVAVPEKEALGDVLDVTVGDADGVAVLVSDGVDVIDIV